MNLRAAVPAVLLVVVSACATSRSSMPPQAVDPVTDPSIVGSVAESADEGEAASEHGARVGRRIGVVAGILAAVLGGPHCDSLGDALDRFLVVSEVSEALGATIGGARGASAGAKRGHDLDVEFAELHDIDGLEVVRPFPDQIDIRMLDEPTEEMMTKLAGVMAQHDARAITIEGNDGPADEILNSMTENGMPRDDLRVRRNHDLVGVVIHIGYR